MEQTNPKEEWKYRRQELINEWVKDKDYKTVSETLLREVWKLQA